jgi:hypothetical protein
LQRLSSECLMIDDGGVRTGLVALPPYPWYSSGELRRRGHRPVARDVRCTSPVSHVPKAVRRDNVSGKIPRMCGDRCLELESRKRAEYFPVTEKMRGLSKSPLVLERTRCTCARFRVPLHLAMRQTKKSACHHWQGVL